MSQIKGKQIKDQSVVLDKLSGTGSVTFNSGTNMTFQSGTTLTRATNDINNLTDVVNKEYVDSIASGLDVKESARLLSDSNITGTYANASSGVGATITTSVATLNIDGIAVANGNRVVLTGQSNAAHNGIYDVSGVGSTVVFTRSTDFDGNPSSEINGGEFVFIKEGNLYADTGFVVSTPNDTITVGSDPINFTQFSAAGVVSPGAGLVAGTGTDIDVNTGIGLTISSDAVRLTNTAVSPGSYGASGTVSTFTVDQQGRLTVAGDVAISITSSQVTDFDSSVLSSVFEVANFVDSSSVDFTVTPGATVSADVKVNTGTGLAVGSSGVEINYGTGLTVSGNQLVVDATTFGVQGADNGLSIDGSSNVILGGTLSQNTSIDGDSSYSLNFENLVGFGVTTSGELDLTTAILDMNAGEASLDASTIFTLTTPKFESNSVDTDFSTDTFDVFADNSIALTATATNGNIDISAFNNVVITSDDVVFNIGSDSIFTDNRGQAVGIRYANTGNPSDYVNDNYSLTTKGYVDDAITNSSYFAGDGIALNGLTFSADLDSDALQITAGKIDLKDTITGDRTFNDSVTITGNLTVNGTVSTVNSEELLVKDNVITLNDGEAGAGVTSGPSGIEIDRGSSDFAKLIFQESDDLFYAGLSGSLHPVVTQAGTGLTQSGNVLSIDTTAFGVQGADNGLSIDGSSNVILGGTLSQNTNIEGNSNSMSFTNLSTFGVTASGQIQLITPGDQIDLTSETLDINNTSTTIDSSGSIIFTSPAFTSNTDDTDFRGDTFDLLYTNNITFNTTAGDMDISVNKNLTATASNINMASSTFVYTDLTPGGGIQYAAAGYVTTNRSLTDKEYVDLGTASLWSAINSITGSDIEEINANAGLSGGGTSGTIDLAVEITPQGGLTFSGAGNAGTLQVEVDGTTIGIVDGALTAVGGSAQPVYQLDNTITAAGTNGSGAPTGMTLNSAPSDYSRIEVYVNGQRQLLGENTTSDCWFGNAGVATALLSLNGGEELIWNSESAGFRLEPSDRVEIVYEA